MKSKKSNLDNAQRLMLVQGVRLIQNGIQFIKWTDLPDEISFEALELLKYRFAYFKDCVLYDGKYYQLIIDRMQQDNRNIKFNLELEKQLHQQLEELQEIVSKEIKTEVKTVFFIYLYKYTRCAFK